MTYKNVRDRPRWAIPEYYITELQKCPVRSSALQNPNSGYASPMLSMEITLRGLEGEDKGT
jgi:hypothetical protein